jgi:hypothetical protein
VANLVFGLGFFALLTLWATAGPGALLLTPLLAFPWAVAVRVAASSVRHVDAGLGLAIRFVARDAVTILVVAVGLAIAAFTFITNIAFALQERGGIGVVIGGLSVWAAVVEAMLIVVLWPVLVDPRREAMRGRDRARLAGYVLIGVPVRLLLTSVVVAAVLFACVYVIALLPTIAIAFIAALTARVGLPASDLVVRRIRDRNRDPDAIDDEDDDDEDDDDEQGAERDAADAADSERTTADSDRTTADSEPTTAD